MTLQLSPGIHFQSLALGNENSSCTTKLLWKNTQEACGREINKSIPATPPSCQMLNSQQKQMIFSWLLSISPDAEQQIQSQEWSDGEREGMAY